MRIAQHGLCGSSSIRLKTGRCCASSAFAEATADRHPNASAVALRDIIQPRTSHKPKRCANDMEARICRQRKTLNRQERQVGRVGGRVGRQRLAREFFSRRLQNWFVFFPAHTARVDAKKDAAPTKGYSALTSSNRPREINIKDVGTLLSKISLSTIVDPPSPSAHRI